MNLHLPRRFSIFTSSEMSLSRAFFPRTKVTYSPADLRNTLTFPLFEDVPDENDIDDRYYSLSPYTSIYKPHRHWCFLGEIGDEIGLLRLGLEVRDTAGACVPVFFHTDDRGESFALRCRKGATLAVLYPNRHNFLDMSVGLRIEDAESVSVLPFSMKELSEANALMWDSVSGSEQKVEGRLCGGCGKGGNLRACSQCKLVFYCGTVSISSQSLLHLAACESTVGG